MVKSLYTIKETQVQSLVGKIPWRREWKPTPVFLPGEFHGQKSLVGYSPKGRKELDTTEMTEHSNTHCHLKFKAFTVFSVEIPKKA